MTSQIPTLTGCKAEPGGEDIPDNGTTNSTSIILAGKGPLLQSYELVNGSNVRPGNFNFEGKLREQVDGLAVGPQEFKLRINVSTQPTSEWKLTVAKSLPAAIMREKLEDTTDDRKIIDLAKLGNAPLSVITLTSDPSIEVGDTIIIKYVASKIGMQDVEVIITTTVGADQFGQKVPNIAEVANDKVIEGATVKVTFDVKRNDELVGSSEKAVAQVVGEKPPAGEVVDDQPFSDSLGGWIIIQVNRGIFDVQGGSKCLRITGQHGHTALFKDFILKPGQYRLSFETRNLGFHPSEVLAGLSGKLIKQACVDEWADYWIEFKASGNNRLFFSWQPWDVALGVAIRNLRLVRLPDTQ